MTTLIKGGTIINADSTIQADVLIDGDQIVAVGTGLEGTPERMIDATGKWVIPGGIDPHTHMELPFGGTFAKDTFETGTRAAAFGGTTTIIDFAVQPRGGMLRDGPRDLAREGRGKACIDYAFHCIVSDMRDDLLPEMDELVDDGVTTFKLFTAYPGVFLSDDAAIFKALRAVGPQRWADPDARREWPGHRRRRGGPRRGRHDRSDRPWPRPLLRLRG